MNELLVSAVRSLNSALRYIGLELIRHRWRRVADIINFKSVDLVIDVGANEGQFGAMIRSLGYKGVIISFEPVTAAFTKLKQRARYDRGWIVEKVAVSSTDGKRDIRVSDRTYFSSFEEPTGELIGYDTRARTISTESTSVTTLDAYCGPRAQSQSSHIYLKIDVQGHEIEVLRGASQTLKRCAAVQVEASLTPIYRNQPLFTEVIELLHAAGFSLAMIVSSEHYGVERPYQLLDADFIFVREP
jgi:FkbM family methyltransferase